MSIEDLRKAYRQPPSEKPLTRRQVAVRAHAAFQAEAMQSRVYAQSTTIMVGALILALVYTVVLGMLDTWTVTRWAATMEPATDVVLRIVPLLRRVTTELVERGYPMRAAHVGHVIAFQWLILAAAFVLTAPSLISERAQLGRAHAAAQETGHKLRPAGSGWRSTLLMLVVLWFGWWSALGASHMSGRFAYDLATGNVGLFCPLFVLTLAWWFALYHLWIRALAALAPGEGPGTVRPRR